MTNTIPTGPEMTTYTALVNALALAISAPDDVRAARAVQLAEHFASSLTASHVARAKREAVKVIKRAGSASLSEGPRESTN